LSRLRSTGWLVIAGTGHLQARLPFIALTLLEGIPLHIKMLNRNSAINRAASSQQLTNELNCTLSQQTQACSCNWENPVTKAISICCSLQWAVLTYGPDP